MSTIRSVNKEADGSIFIDFSKKKLLFAPTVFSFKLLQFVDTEYFQLSKNDMQSFRCLIV